MTFAPSAFPNDAASNEALIGSIEIAPTEGLTPSAGQLPAASTAPPMTSDDEADAHVFTYALSELSAGRIPSAQRQFELFVATSPNHPLASAARRHLASIYQGQAAATVAGPTTPTTRPAIVAAPIKPELTLVPPRRLSLDVRAPSRLEDSFMSEAGDRVFFSPGSAELGQRARVVLQAQARWLKRNAALYAVVEGHADDQGLNRDEAVKLSQARADAVIDRLVEEGIPRQRLAPSAWGRDLPVATCSSSECAAQNRRAVTILTPQRLSELPSVDVGGTRAP
ncbi:MAG: OmpA family protein [Hyphomicrobium sp.]|nr:OmpA family protein [Hyphomicrobium sp.]